MSTLNNELQCDLVRVAYDFNSKTAQVVVAEGDGYRLRGLVRFFEGIDPDVDRIEVLEGNSIDRTYHLTDDGWVYYRNDHDLQEAS